MLYLLFLLSSKGISTTISSSGGILTTDFLAILSSFLILASSLANSFLSSLSNSICSFLIFASSFANSFLSSFQILFLLFEFFYLLHLILS